jgi:hypothetical protein
VEGGQPPAGPTPPADTPPAGTRPNLTVPQLLAVAAFLLFVFLAWVAGDPVDPEATLNGTEYDELRTLTLFLIGALLPSDALIRFGRSILFSKVDDPDTSASYAPATTRAQILAVVVYLAVVVAMLAGNDIVTATEGTQIVDVAQALIIALLPSDAAIRFGRALNLSKVTGSPSEAQLSRV